MDKAPDAFRTISEVSDWLDTPTHVLRFWESRFPEVAPVKRAGGRRYYRVEDVLLLGGIKKLLHEDGVTIKALQDRIKSEGAESVAALSPPLDVLPPGEEDDGDSSAAKHEASGTSRALPPRSGRQRSLSLGDAPAAKTPTPATPAPATPVSEAAAPKGASFQRHPARVSREAVPKPEPKKTKHPHPSRPGLFLYDDSDLQSIEPADAADAASKPTLGPIDDVPADIDDDCASPHAVPLTAELRALAALAPARLPAASETLSRLRTLRDRWT